MTNGYNTPIGVPIGLPSILSLGLPPLVNPYPTLNLDFINNPQFDSRITFSRGSQATLFDSTGTLRYAKHNLALQSQDFATTWGVVRASISTDATTAPNGTVTADKLIEDTTASNTHIVRQIGLTIASATPYLFSVYLKAGERTKALLQTTNTGFSNNAYVIFDLIAGTVVANVSATSAAIVDVGNGWYRCSMGNTSTGTVGNLSIGLVDAANNPSYTGDGTSGVFLWGAQLNIANMEGGVTSSLTTYYPTTTAAYYAPRFDYNPSTLQPRGLLIEEQRTNLLTYSQPLNIGWVKSGTATVTDNNALAPDGAVAAALISSPATSDYIYQAPTTVIGQSYIFSVFVKNSTATISRLWVRTSSTAADILLNWSGATLSSVTQTTGTATFTPVGNDWYRVFVTYTAVETAARHRIYGGDGTSTTGNILIYGTQLEAGAFATSYIPTTTTALTRNADVASMTGTNFSSWYNNSTGTFYAQFLVPQANASGLWRVFSGNVTNTPQFFNNGGLYNWSYSSDGVSTLSAPVANVVTKFAGAYAANDVIGAINGTLGTADTSVTTNTPTALTLGAANAVANRELNGWLQRIAYYPTRLPNTTLQALTA